VLGLDDYEFFNYPSPFLVESRPIYWLPTVKMHYGMTYDEELRWVVAVDQILNARPDRKIVIHTVSYARQQFLLDNSKFRHRMLANSRDDTAATIQAFKAAKEPLVLVTPSADTGVDFPGVECETVIIIKVPFSDTSSKIYQARAAEDSEYGAYVAAQTLVQMSGRGMRSESDRCETIILDMCLA
jgi:Rad3-related DNA helicase